MISIEQLLCRGCNRCKHSLGIKNAWVAFRHYLARGLPYDLWLREQMRSGDELVLVCTPCHADLLQQEREIKEQHHGQ